MKQGKKSLNIKKKEKLIMKFSVQEQLAKNAEDNKNLKEQLIKPSINKLDNETFENKIEHDQNKFDILYFESKSQLDDKESNDDLKNISNNMGSDNNKFEKELNDNKVKFNNKKDYKKRQGPFKSTAADFKIKYKTELCKYYEINGYCKYGESCAYAHDKENLRSKITNTTAYRTRNCAQFFQNGYCPYGNRCQFAHQITSNIINNPYDRKMSYTKILEMISKQENIENIKSLILKNRLPVFKNIVTIKKDVKNTLLDDIKNIYKEGIIERIDN